MSTFTDWNGPQGGGARAADLIQLANAYTDLVSKLSQHMSDKTPDTSDVHGIKTYVEAQLKTIKDLIPETSAFITEQDADGKYASKSEIPTNTVKSDDLKSYVKTTDLNTALADYLKTNDLKEQQLIKDIQTDVGAIKTALGTNPFEMPALKATKYVEGIMHAVEQVMFTDKRVSAYVGGADSAGNYYLLGMLLDKAGTAYIKYVNTDPFSASVNFAYTPDDKGALSVVCDNSVWDALKFKIVAGTDATGEKHAYLAVQAPDWVVDQIVFECAGINFCPIGSEDWVAPNGNCHDVVDCFAYTGFSASQLNIDDKDSAPTENSEKVVTSDGIYKAIRKVNIKIGAKIGEIMDWPQFRVERRSMISDNPFEFTFNGQIHSVAVVPENVELEIADNVPEDWRAMDGSVELDAATNPELAEFFGGRNTTTDGKIWIPYLPRKIIRIAY